MTKPVRKKSPHLCSSLHPSTLFFTTVPQEDSEFTRAEFLQSPTRADLPARIYYILFIYLFIYFFIHSFIHLFLHLFIHLLVVFIYLLIFLFSD